MLDIGDKEQETKNVAVRKRGEGEIGASKVDDIIARVLAEIGAKA